MKKPQVIMETCTMCDGAGVRPSNTTGAIMRLEREGRGLPRNAVVPHFLKPDGRETYSESYLIDLERDSRAWSCAMIASYRAAIEAAAKTQVEVKV